MDYPAIVQIGLDGFAVIGTCATLWGLYKTYGELSSVRSQQEQDRISHSTLVEGLKKETIDKIEEVRASTQQQIQDTISLVTVVDLIRLIEQIQDALKQRQWEIAYFRCTLLRDRIVPMEPRIEKSMVRTDFSKTMAALPVTCDVLYGKCCDGRKTVNPININSELSALKDNLTLLESKLKQKVTMFADANDKVRLVRHRSRGLRAPCREAPPRCFS